MGDGYETVFCAASATQSRQGGWGVGGVSGGRAGTKIAYIRIGHTCAY
jgi:hypothetical protein